MACSSRGRRSTEVGDDGSPGAVVECFYGGMRVRGSAGEWAGCDKAQGLRVWLSLGDVLTVKSMGGDSRILSSISAICVSSAPLVVRCH